MKIRAIITGVTGMVGEGVLHECLSDPDVEQILIVNRKPSGFSHPKLKEVIHADFFNIESIADQFSGYNACYFCLGVSSVGMKEPEYTKLTYDLTIGFAKILAAKEPEMVFCYVSGNATDSTENGRIMWARVKGRTENELLRLFKNGYMFRPGYMHPTPGLKNTQKYYRYLSWSYPIVKLIAPDLVSTLADLGRAMIQVTRSRYTTHHIEVKNIKALSKQSGR